MLDEALATLAISGATTFVGAMATDSWQAVRSRIGRLFRQRVPDSDDVEARLDEDARLVRAAETPSHVDAVRDQLLRFWSDKLVLLLERHPDSEAELRALVGQIHDELPVTRAGSYQTNISHGSSVLFATQHGDVHYHQAPGRKDA